jgi:hypothetical protein
MQLRNYLFVCFLFYIPLCIAQGIKGIVADTKEKPIGFITIYCKELKKGTNSNADGTYELQLPAGNYNITFQSVGYKAHNATVTVSNDWTVLNITLQEQAYELKEVNINNGGTNPAVFIMRKAIAAAPYYRRQVLMYNAKIYSKGSGKLDEIPFLFEKLLKKEGFSEGQTFLLESINEVSFTQPNTYKEKALSIKSSIPTEGAPEPMRMIRGSMYNTSDPDFISPLSPQAFSVYTFKLEGSYYEGKREVNRIKVTPKRKGQDVMEGYVYIMEGLWCLHSTDLTNNANGFQTKIVTSFRPLNGYDFVWMPVTYDITVKGGYLGFKGSFRYLCSVANYNIKLNPNLDHSWVQKQTKENAAIPLVKEEEVVKPKIQAESKKSKRQEDIEKLLAKEELSKMDMLKLANKMKAESEAQGQQSLEIKPDSSEIIIDSLATKRDSSFWQENRPVALMESEVVSYKQFDSVISKKERDSTVRKNDSSFHWMGIFTGNDWKFNKGQNQFKWSGIIGQGSEIFVNTVDGWGGTVQWSIGSVRKDAKEWTLTNRIRVPFERKALNTIGKFEYWYNPKVLGKFDIEGGTYTSDFNTIGGPSMFVNNLILLIDKRNLQKLYQHDFVRVTNQIELTNGLLWKSNLAWFNRYELWNIPRYANKETLTGKITPNEPVLGYNMPTHQATIFHNTFTYTPKQRYRMERGKKQYVNGKWPTVELGITNGIPDLLSSDIDFMSMQLSITERIKPLHWLSINARISSQFFMYNHASYFPDYSQAVGNQSPIFNGDPLYRFRQLNYYQYANTTSITTLHTELDFKRLLVKRLPLINMTSIREVVFYNGLYTPSNPVYQELGYGIDEIMGVMRLDVFAGFKNTKYNNWGIRLVLNIKGIE